MMSTTIPPDEPTTGAALTTPSEQTPPSGPELLRDFLGQATQGGLFPLVAYSIGDDATEPTAAEPPPSETDADEDGEVLVTEEQGNQDLGRQWTIPETRVRVLTTSIPDLTYALGILERATPYGYNLGKRLWPTKLLRLQQENPHVFYLREASIPGFTSDDQIRIGLIVID